jgi:hypothetical protein
MPCPASAHSAAEGLPLAVPTELSLLEADGLPEDQAPPPEGIPDALP